jgi:hypothetical protein
VLQRSFGGSYANRDDDPNTPVARK